MNLNLAIRVKNLIFLDFFLNEYQIFHNFFTAFYIKKSTLNYAITSTIYSCFAELDKVNVHQFWKWSINYFSCCDVRKLKEGLWISF